MYCNQSIGEEQWRRNQWTLTWSRRYRSSRQDWWLRFKGRKRAATFCILSFNIGGELHTSLIEDGLYIPIRHKRFEQNCVENCWGRWQVASGYNQTRGRPEIWDSDLHDERLTLSGSLEEADWKEHGTVEWHSNHPGRLPCIVRPFVPNIVVSVTKWLLSWCIPLQRGWLISMHAFSGQHE